MTNAIWVIQYLLTMILDYVSTSWKNKRVLQIKVVYDFLQQIRIVGSERLVKWKMEIFDKEANNIIKIRVIEDWRINASFVDSHYEII